MKKLLGICGLLSVAVACGGVGDDVRTQGEADVETIEQETESVEEVEEVIPPARGFEPEGVPHDELIDLQGARLDGDFGVTFLNDSPATSALLATTAYDTMLLIERMDENTGEWSMILLMSFSPTETFLPAPGEEVRFRYSTVGSEAPPPVDAMVCSSSEGEDFDVPADEIVISAEDNGAGGVDYEVGVTTAGADATGTFTL
jgi:hypothetical protein